MFYPRKTKKIKLSLLSYVHHVSFRPLKASSSRRRLHRPRSSVCWLSGCCPPSHLSRHRRPRDRTTRQHVSFLVVFILYQWSNLFLGSEGMLEQKYETCVQI